MGQQQSQEQEPQPKQSKLLSWLDQRLVGPLIGALIAAIVGGRIVILITGVQFNIGLMVLVTLVILVVIGVSFFLGMSYVVFAFFGLFTKQKPPLLHRIAATISMVVLFPLYWREWKEEKNRQPPSEFTERILARIREKQESKDTKK